MERIGIGRGQFGVYALLWLSGLAGCRHKEPPPAPPAATAPPPAAPAPITVITPLPSVPAVAGPNVQPAPPELPAPQPAPVKPTSKHRRFHHSASPPPSEVASNGAAPKGSAETAGKETPAPAPVPAPAPKGDAATAGSASSASVNAATAVEAAPALGELSTGTAISGVERNRLLREIQGLEARLSKVRQPSTQDALAVQMQVKTFLERAREAVQENDLDGAHTLNTKATVLLDELQSE